jgi:hypothetical protein
MSAATKNQRRRAKAKEVKAIKVEKRVQLTNFANWEAFAERFKDGVNPVLEWKRSNRSMVGGDEGDFAVMSVLHHDVDDGRTPFLVELPWSYQAARYIRTNQVDILQLPDLEQFPEHPTRTIYVPRPCGCGVRTASAYSS